MFYRFKNGNFIEADTFEEAKKVAIDRIEREIEDPDSWHKCNCVGFDHRYSCPESNHNKGIIPF